MEWIVHELYVNFTDFNLFILILNGYAIVNSSLFCNKIIYLVRN